MEKDRNKGMEKRIDARGLQCPLPVIEAKKAIEAMTEGGTITVIVDNEIAVQNVLKLAKQKAIDVEYESVSKEEYVVILNIDRVIKQREKVQEEKKKVVIITSNAMGSGDDTLGKTLMKGFIFALLKQDILPDQIIFYNSGAFLVAEGSDSLEDLKSLEAEGVEIMACGACLDYYDLTEKRKVGSVTNMYAITEIMLNAGLIIRP